MELFFVQMCSHAQMICWNYFKFIDSSVILLDNNNLFVDSEVNRGEKELNGKEVGRTKITQWRVPPARQN